MTKRIILRNGPDGRSNGRSAYARGHEGIAGEDVTVGRASCNGRPAHGTNHLNDSKNKHPTVRRTPNGLLFSGTRPLSRDFDRVQPWSPCTRGRVGAVGPPHTHRIRMPASRQRGIGRGLGRVRSCAPLHVRRTCRKYPCRSRPAIVMANLVTGLQ